LLGKVRDIIKDANQDAKLEIFFSQKPKNITKVKESESKKNGSVHGYRRM